MRADYYDAKKQELIVEVLEKAQNTLLLFSLKWIENNQVIWDIKK